MLLKSRCMTKILYSILAIISFYSTVFAQHFILDNPIKVGKLIVFPKLKSESEYFYLPSIIKLARNDNNIPQFSFLKYVRNLEQDSESANVIKESDHGGGIVHAVFILEVPEEILRDAENELRRKGSNAKIVGPVLFKSGTVSLISSFNSVDGEKVKKVIGLGTAPSLDGSKMALSVELTKEGADILWATFETPTPDFSISMEMEVEGYLSPKQVKISADWDKIYNHHNFQAAVATPVLSGEIVDTYDELKDQGAIKIEQIGEDVHLEKLLQTAYDKLTNLMFDKIGGTGIPELSQLSGNGQKSMLDRATESLEKGRKEAMEYNLKLADHYKQRAEMNEKIRKGAYERLTKAFKDQGRELIEPKIKRNQNDSSETENENTKDKQSYDLPPYEAVPTISAAVSYVMKRQRQSGKFEIDMSKYTSDVRTFRFDENVGNVKKICKSCFVKVNLDDPLYKQRDIRTRLDGLNFNDFGSYINSVEISMRKKHQNGHITNQGLVIDRRKFNESANNYSIQYGWNGDDNRTKWLEYEYRTKWSFFGGINIETPWTASEDNNLTLTPPLYRKPILIELDQKLIKEEKINAVEVMIAYSINGNIKKEKLLFRRTLDEYSKTVYLVQPYGDDHFEYQVTWFQEGKTPKVIPPIQSNYGYIILNKIQ